MSDNTQASASLPWTEVSALMNSEQFGDRFAVIPTETLEYATDSNNYQALVETALENIKKTEPEKANLEYAAQVADLMIKFATQVLRERTLN